jgi:hypothetical protein
MQKGDPVKLRSEAAFATATVFKVTGVRVRGGDEEIKAEATQGYKEKIPWTSSSAFVLAL